MARKKKAKKPFKERTFFGKIIQATTAPVRAVAKAAKGVAEGVVFAPLIPFRKMMENKVRESGNVPPKKMSELVRSFHKNVLKKRNLEGLEHNYEIQENLVDDIVDVVKDIVGFFKHSKEKKEAGNATPLELLAANTAEAVKKTKDSVAGQKAIDKALNEDGDGGDGDGEKPSIFSIKNVLIGLGVAGTIATVVYAARSK